MIHVELAWRIQTKMESIHLCQGSFFSSRVALHGRALVSQSPDTLMCSVNKAKFVLGVREVRNKSKASVFLASLGSGLAR